MSEAICPCQNKSHLISACESNMIHLSIVKPTLTSLPDFGHMYRFVPLQSKF